MANNNNTVTKADLEVMIKELKEENERLAKENKSLKSTEDTDTEALKEAKEAEEYLNEKVDVYLHRGSSDEEKEDVFVGCDGEFILIKRGHHVQIPRKFALIVENAERQRTINDERMDAKEAEWEEKYRRI